MQGFFGYLFKKRYSREDFTEPLLEAIALFPLSMGIFSGIFYGNFELVLVSQNVYVNSALAAGWIFSVIWLIWRKLR